LSKSSYLTADLDYLLKDCDLDKVRHAIEATPGYSELPFPDQEECKELVWLAAETWLARDLQEFEEIRVEEKLDGGKAFIDLQGLMRGTIAPYDKYPGFWELVDFKTKAAPVDTEAWRSDCLLSWQHKYYAALRPEARYFTYRGISRERAIRTEKDDWYEAQRVREVRLELCGGIDVEVQIQKRSLLAQYNALVAEKLPIWTRNTKNCLKYGKCWYKDDCDTNSMPQGTEGIDPLDNISYSRGETFMFCPEKARRNKLREIDNEIWQESDATTIGVAAHAGFAALWLEAFAKR